jgi:hypothetical protein
MENSCNPLLHGEGQVTVSVSRCHAQLANERESKDARGTCQLIMIPNTKSLGPDRLARTGMATNPEPPQFRCKAGEPVPEVDPEDLKEVWKMTRDNRQMGFGAATAAQTDKSPAVQQALGYRASLLSAMPQLAPDELARFTRDGELQDCVFTAAAKTPMEWIGEGRRPGLPFDVQEFLRLCAWT